MPYQKNPYQKKPHQKNARKIPHQKNAHLAVVAPGQYYSYERKRTEIYTEVFLQKDYHLKIGIFICIDCNGYHHSSNDKVLQYLQVGFSYRYQVYHRIAYSLPLPHKEVRKHSWNKKIKI